MSGICIFLCYMFAFDVNSSHFPLMKAGVLAETFYFLSCIHLVTNPFLKSDIIDACFYFKILELSAENNNCFFFQVIVHETSNPSSHTNHYNRLRLGAWPIKDLLRVCQWNQDKRRLPPPSHYSTAFSHFIKKH